MQPTRMRPHWWAVLAVSVSLLALVAATSDHPNPPGNERVAHSAAANPRKARSTALPPTTTTTAVPGQGPGTVTPPSSPSVPTTTGTTEGAQVMARQSSATTTTTSTTTSPTGGSNVAATPVQTVATVERVGDLQQPDDASASYQFAGAGSMQVSASSTLTIPLLLTVTCPLATLSKQGSSTISVVIPNADGPCDVVLKEIVVQYVAVPFTLTIGPQGG
jgi:hypothetical protein